MQKALRVIESGMRRKPTEADFRFIRLIRTARRRAGMKQKELAAKLGVTPATVSHWETGVQFPPDPHRPAIAEALGIELGAEEVRMQVSETGVEYTGRCTLSLFLTGSALVTGDGERIGDIGITMGEAEVADRAYRLTDDSMTPGFRKGWTIGIRLTDQAKAGQFVIAAVGGDVVFRRYEGMVDGSILLRPLNHGYDVISRRDVRIIGVARWIRGETLDGTF
jgi:SOS-response transcriptional repressor LexA